MDEIKTERRLLRRWLSRLGWGMLAFFAVYLAGGGLVSVALVQRWPGQLTYGLELLLTDAVTYGLAPLGLWLVIRKLPKGRAEEPVSLSRRAWLRTAVFSLGLGYALSYATSFLQLALSDLFGASETDLSTEIISQMSPVAMIGLVVIVAPVCEELIFRGLVLNRLRFLGERGAVMLSALLFALFHLNLSQFFFAFGLGCVFGAVVIKTGKLRYTISFHMLVNGVSCIAMLTMDVTWALAAFGVFVIACIAGAVYIFIRWRPRYHFVPGPYSGGQTLRSMAAAPGFVLMVLFSGAISISVLFL